jgi:DNA invertase Pin-like site-specific DNA recombinase
MEAAVRAGLYARVSTDQQTAENQLLELRRYVEARGWTATEFVDQISGTKESRPALGRLEVAARKRRIDVVVVWRLDRLGRNLKHLVTLLDTWQALGVAFVSMGEGIDATTPAGKLQLHILAALAEFERARIVERVRLGLARAKAHGTKLGRKRLRVTSEQLASVEGLSTRAAAAKLGISKSAAAKLLSKKPLITAPQNTSI